MPGPPTLSQCLESVDSTVGRQRVADYLKSRPFPHYEAASGRPGLLIRIGEDGSRTLGRFVNRRSEPSRFLSGCALCFEALLVHQ